MNPNPFPAKKNDFEIDQVMVVETNVDDVTGEILARAVESCLEMGAYDAILVPFIGKKGRGGYTLRVVCGRDSADEIARIIIEETGTLGVKMVEYLRYIVPRKVMHIPVRIKKFKGNVSVKIALGRKGQIVRIKPEIAEIEQIAKRERLSMREVMDQVTLSARKVASSNRKRQLR